MTDREIKILDLTAQYVKVHKGLEDLDVFISDPSFQLTDDDFVNLFKIYEVEESETVDKDGVIFIKYLNKKEGVNFYTVIWDDIEKYRRRLNEN